MPSLTQILLRPFWLIVSSLSLVLGLTLSILLYVSWHTLQKIQPLKDHVELIEQVSASNTLLSQLTNLPMEQQIPHLEHLKQAIQHVQQLSPALEPEARDALLRAEHQLHPPFDTSTAYLVQDELQNALLAESNAQNKLLQQLAKDSELEVKTALSATLMIVMLGLLTLFFLRGRLLRPLNQLGLLLSRLGREPVANIPLEDIDPLLQPLFRHFKQTVNRLNQLELEQQQYQSELEQRVHQATQSLLEYHHSLAQSERLAAVGELTATLAHELRNPLTGVQLALSNLQQESDNPEHKERLGLVLESLGLVTRELNQVLDQSRHTPEAPSEFLPAELCDNLLQLVRYQLPPTIQLSHQVQVEQPCYLPAGRLRQALMNLLLNAAHAVGKQAGNISLHVYNQTHFIVFEICDSGPGFPAKILEQGIQPFASNREQGTGLGLAIVRRFCYEQQGRLWLENPPQGGACVRMQLPLGHYHG